MYYFKCLLSIELLTTLTNSLVLSIPGAAMTMLSYLCTKISFKREVLFSVVKGLEPPGDHVADHLVWDLGKDLLAEAVAVVGPVGHHELLHLDELNKKSNLDLNFVHG